MDRIKYAFQNKKDCSVNHDENTQTICKQIITEAKRTSGSRGSSATTDGEDQLVSIAILQQGSEESRPVRSNSVVTGSQKGVDVVGSDLCLAIVESESSKTGHEFVL